MSSTTIIHFFVHLCSWAKVIWQQVQQLAATTTAAAQMVKLLPGVGFGLAYA